MMSELDEVMDKIKKMEDNNALRLRHANQTIQDHHRQITQLKNCVKELEKENRQLRDEAISNLALLKTGSSLIKIKTTLATTVGTLSGPEASTAGTAKTTQAASQSAANVTKSSLRGAARVRPIPAAAATTTPSVKLLVMQ